MSTSQLQKFTSRMLSIHLAQFTIRENARPSWLEGLELDFFLEEIKTAIEVQGSQHYEYNPHFHGDYTGFLASLERDRHKAALCGAHDVTLLYASAEDEVLAIIESLPSTYQHPPHANAIAAQKYPQRRKRRMVPAKGLALSLGLSAATVQDQARHGMFSSEIRTVVFPGKGGTRMTFVDERQVRAYNSMSYKEKLAHGRRMRVG